MTEEAAALQAAVRERLADRAPHTSRVDYPHAYASEALACSRRIGYRMADYTHTDQPDTASLIAFAIGDHLHAYVQRALADLHADFEPEVSWAMDATTGRADGVYTHPQHGKTIVEIKTMADDKFTEAVESNAPQSEHMLQADLSALALGAEWVDIIYINKGRNKPPRARKGQPQQEPLDPVYLWHYKADLRHARREADRHANIQQGVAADELPDRFYQGLDIDPATTNFPCRWCPFRAVCLEDGPGAVPLNRR